MGRWEEQSENQCVGGRGVGDRPRLRSGVPLLHLLDASDFPGVRQSLGWCGLFQVCFAVFAFSEGRFERGPQGQDGHLEALEAEAVSFGPSQLREHVGLSLGKSVLNWVHTLKAPLFVNGTICSDLWNIPQLLFNVGRIISGISI